MKKKINYSIILQIGLLLTFFLPFFPHGCLKPEQAAPATDSVAVDTAHIVADSTSIDNSSTIDSTSLVKNIEETDSVKSDSIYNSSHNTNNPSNEDKELSLILSNKSIILKCLLRPNNNYTGIATLLDTIGLFQYGFSLGLAFILWIISLVIKLKDFNNIYLFINILGTVLLFFSHPLTICGDNKLWGFWVCLVWSILMTVYDLYILKKQKIISA